MRATDDTDCAAVESILSDSALPWQPADARPATFEDGEELLVRCRLYTIVWIEQWRVGVVAMTSGALETVFKPARPYGTICNWGLVTHWCPMAAVTKGLPE